MSSNDQCAYDFMVQLTAILSYLFWTFQKKPLKCLATKTLNPDTHDLLVAMTKMLENNNRKSKGIFWLTM